MFLCFQAQRENRRTLGGGGQIEGGAGPINQARSRLEKTLNSLAQDSHNGVVHNTRFNFVLGFTKGEVRYVG